jgi:aminoglycoside phosphotransferase (APT) family kinase protein
MPGYPGACHPCFLARQLLSVRCPANQDSSLRSVAAGVKSALMKDDALEAAGRAERVNREARPVSVEGEVVSRPSSSATSTVHSLLRHLRAQGLDCVPEPLDVRDGVETLRFIEGADGGEGWYHQHTGQGLTSAARLLRRIHDASRGWTPPADAVWGAPAVSGDDIVYCHGDPGPWNFIWRDNEAAALIDWDYLHPAPRLDDVAYALRWFAPLRSDQLALEWHHFPEVPDRRHRIKVFLDSYGDLPAFDVVDTVIARMQATIDLCQSLAAQGREPQRTWAADGALEQEAAEIAWVRQHRSLIA